MFQVFLKYQQMVVVVNVWVDHNEVEVKNV
jgi:hypothetical protein